QLHAKDIIIGVEPKGWPGKLLLNVLRGSRSCATQAFLRCMRSCRSNDDCRGLPARGFQGEGWSGENRNLRDKFQRTDLLDDLTDAQMCGGLQPFGRANDDRIWRKKWQSQ